MTFAVFKMRNRFENSFLCIGPSEYINNDFHLDISFHGLLYYHKIQLCIPFHNCFKSSYFPIIDFSFIKISNPAGVGKCIYIMENQKARKLLNYIYLAFIWHICLYFVAKCFHAWYILYVRKVSFYFQRDNKW